MLCHFYFVSLINPLLTEYKNSALGKTLDPDQMNHSALSDCMSFQEKNNFNLGIMGVAAS